MRRNAKRLRNVVSQYAVFGISPGKNIDLVLTTLLINVLGLALPLILLQLYDRIIPNQGSDSLIWLAVGVGTAIVLEGLMRFVREVLATDLGAEYEKKLSMRTFQSIVNADLSAVEKFDVMGLIDRSNATTSLRKAYCNQFFQSALDLPFAFAYIGIIYLLNPNAALYMGGVALAMLIVTLQVRRNYEFAKRNLTTENTQSMNIVHELINKIHFVKAMSIEEMMLRKYEQQESQVSSLTKDVSDLEAAPGNWNALFSNFALFGVIAIGASQSISGEMTLGVLTASMILASRSIEPLQRFLQFFLKRSETVLACDKVRDLLHLPGEIRSDATPLANQSDWSVFLEDVSFQYPGQNKPVFSKINLGLPHGKLLGFTSSGSQGTTTLLHLINGILRPTAGNVYLGEYELDKVHESQLIGRVAYIPETAVVFRGTVLENIAHFNQKYFQKALEIAAMLQIDMRISYLPRGYQTQLDRESNLSLPRSLIQLIGLTRALVTEPGILLLDRADASLDQDATRVFIETLERLRGNCTVIMVTENPDLLSKTDKIFQVSSGNILDVNREMLQEQAKTKPSRIWQGAA